MRHTTLAVVLLVVTAGCQVGLPGAAAGPGTETPTYSPAPVPTLSSTPSTLAPGITAGGVVDHGALGQAHRSVLAANRYGRLVTLEVRPARGPPVYRYQRLRRAGPDGVLTVAEVRRDWDRDGTETVARTVWWAPESGPIIARSETEDGRIVTRRVTVVPPPRHRARGPARLLDLATRNVTAGPRPGTVELSGTTSVAPGVADDWRPNQAVSVRATVSRRGLMRELRVAYSSRVDGSPGSVAYIDRYFLVDPDPGEAPTAPTWYPSARNATS
ncbi:hypothetical protein [Haloglomus litoreum]|uniref:hypothetical protein n=1 Tax=Haloglomus litoreum TaxID=3034026 RepID=UPI0023E83205|nr:hypothetical protein [Haloglomus sp. DT116]